MSCANLDLHQAQATELIIKDGCAAGIKIKTGQTFWQKRLIIATGTYLASKIHIGLTSHKSGPLGMVAGTEFARSLKTGLEIGRLRTDTTPRIQTDTINWQILDRQEYYRSRKFFPFQRKRTYSGITCGLTRTNENTHRIMREYFSQSPLVQGTLKTEGPRYCPSIDDKVLKVSRKFFLEPISPESREVYMQNFSTSMCLEAQFETVKGQSKDVKTLTYFDCPYFQIALLNIDNRKIFAYTLHGFLKGL